MANLIMTSQIANKFLILFILIYSAMQYLAVWLSAVRDKQKICGSQKLLYNILFYNLNKKVS